MAHEHQTMAGSIARRRFLHLLWSSAAGFAAPATDAPPFFEEIPPAASGIQWKHVAGLSSKMYVPETIGPGCAFLDYDNDGWMDLYLVNSGPCDFYSPSAPLSNALYRNNRDGAFTDVTEKAGVRGSAYGMDAAVGDFDGDGLPDLYVTQYPRSILYRNNGDGTFTDVTEKAGVAAPGWSSSAVWFDYDNDGRLDLFVPKDSVRRTAASPAHSHPAGGPPSARSIFVLRPAADRAHRVLPSAAAHCGRLAPASRAGIAPGADETWRSGSRSCPSVPASKSNVNT